jgi:phosphoribosyl-ATP pyrophosphohydrolase/phosphoribosyl-AMP cyclohydrolase
MDLDSLDFTRGEGRVTVVTQDAGSAAVLMVAGADREALDLTLSTGVMHYRSRTRGLWKKGATSGNTQRLISLVADCDGDALLALVDPAGPACHTGAASCFGNVSGAAGGMARLDAVIAMRAAAPPEPGAPPGYTRALLQDRNLRLKKLGEEAAELAVACADGDRERAVAEAADLVYHALVALRAVGAGWSDVLATLAARSR